MMKASIAAFKSSKIISITILVSDNLKLYLFYSSVKSPKSLKGTNNQDIRG